VIKILQGCAITQIMLGGLTTGIHPPVANFLHSVTVHVPKILKVVWH